MSQFEFSIVVVSIVIAMAISEVLATLGRMIRYRGRIRPYWVHVGWMALVLLLAIQFWWSQWELREWPGWTFSEYVLSLLPFFTLVVLTFLICPDMAEEGHAETNGGRTELESYYYENASWFFGLAGAFIVQLMLINPFLRGDAWWGPENAIRLLALAAILPLSRTQSRAVHAAALLACLGLFGAFVALGGS